MDAPPDETLPLGGSVRAPGPHHPAAELALFRRTGELAGCRLFQENWLCFAQRAVHRFVGWAVPTGRLAEQIGFVLHGWSFPAWRGHLGLVPFRELALFRTPVSHPRDAEGREGEARITSIVSVISVPLW